MNKNRRSKRQETSEMVIRENRYHINGASIEFVMEYARSYKVIGGIVLIASILFATLFVVNAYIPGLFISMPICLMCLHTFIMQMTEKIYVTSSGIKRTWLFRKGEVVPFSEITYLKIKGESLEQRTEVFTKKGKFFVASCAYENMDLFEIIMGQYNWPCQ